MLTAVLFLIMQVGRALGMFVSLNVKLTDSSSIKMYWLIVLPFLLSMFIKLFYIAVNKSVDVSNKKKV